MTSTVTVSDVVADVLGEHVRHVFLVPGGGSMHLVDAFGRSPVVSPVANLHEQACAVAADAYGQITGQLGAALLTTGPGGLNALTGVAAAWLDSTPCVFVSGQVKRNDRVGDRGVRQMGFQEIDIVSLAARITKAAVTVEEPESVLWHMQRAVHLARSGRPGPVWVELPLDVQAAPVDRSRLEGFTPGPRETPSSAALAEPAAATLALLQRAKRPALLVGNGVRLAGAVPQLMRLVELLGAPVLTTWKAADLIPDDHPLFAGRPGSISQRGANFTQQNADVLLVLGARLDAGQTGYSHENFARGADKIIVDVDAAEVAKLDMPIAVPVIADVKDFLEALLPRVEAAPPQPASAWRARVAAWRERWPLLRPEAAERVGVVDNYAFMDVLSEELTADDLLVPGSSGACSEITMQAFRVKAGQRIVNSQGLGSMGFAVPAALGACLAAGGRRTVSVDGDGGFPMNSQELETIRRLGLPIKLFVLDNGGYGSIRATQRRYFEGRLVASDPGSGLTLPSAARLARAHGIPSTRLTDHKGLRAGVREVLQAEGPMVCEVAVPPDQGPEPRLASFRRSDGSMASRPLEDLWPFLDRDELADNLLVPPAEESS